VVTAHDIHCNAHKQGAEKPAGKLRARRDGQNLAAFVEAARRTNAMRQIRCVALRAFVQLREFEHAVVSAALMLPAR